MQFKAILLLAAAAGMAVAAPQDRGVFQPDAANSAVGDAQNNAQADAVAGLEADRFSCAPVASQPEVISCQDGRGGVCNVQPSGNVVCF